VALAEALVGHASSSCLRSDRQPGDLQPRTRTNDRGAVDSGARPHRHHRLVRGTIDRGAGRVQQVFLLVPPVVLITMLPISIAGWGVREATMGLAFGYAGLATNEGINVSLLFGAVSFVVGAFGGLVWIFSAEKAAQDTIPIELRDNSHSFEPVDCTGVIEEAPQIRGFGRRHHRRQYSASVSALTR